jgi:outer membrane protein assembly factor BamD
MSLFCRKVFSRNSVIALAVTLAFTTACTNKKVSNPLAKVDSKQPDKVLFDRGMDALKHNRFDVARLEMQTLINTYPDSEFIARAKLSLADSWYAEGGTAALAQAEAEYKDFETFFPNMPEAAEAQLKIANIHFQQMEKPDRDFTHAVRAEQEYRQVILQYPDNKQMVEEARKKLLQVQEVIADREFRVGRFYYLRQSYPAAIARLQSLADRYPLYSKADETLFMLGQSYEGEISLVNRNAETEQRQLEKRGVKMDDSRRKNEELARERMISDFTAKAAEAYSKILTRYPVMERSDEAKTRLEALHQPVPRPTKAALALNKSEEAARGDQTMLTRMMGTINRHPDTSSATKVGDPTLEDKTPVSASTIVQQANTVAMGPASDSKTVSVETTGTGAPPENQPPPRSDDPQASQTATQEDQAQPQPDPNELKPNQAVPNASSQSTPVAANPAAADPNELKPNVGTDSAPQAAPAQVNELAAGSGAGGNEAQPGNPPAASSNQELADDKDIASSKHKKKKGLKKVIPFS